MRNQENKTRSMLRGRRAVPSAVFAVALVAIVLPAVPAIAASGSGGHVANAPRGGQVAVNTKAVLAYWTPARIKAAIPVSVISAGKAAPMKATQKPSGGSGKVAGHGPTDPKYAHKTASPGVSNCTSGSCPYDSFEVTPAPNKKGQDGVWTSYPYDVNGALFFENDGSDYVCSGTVVGASNPNTQNEIWTAGHCLVNTEANNQVVDSNAVFVPAYNGSANISYASAKKIEKWAPFGVFTWDGAYETTTAWLDNRDLTEDESAMQFGTSDVSGDTLGQAVGWDGFTWGQSVTQQFVTFGYPAASPYNGEDMEEDIATTGGQDSNGGADGTNPIYIGSPFTGGSSGGAWNTHWSDSGPGYIDGHNDYVYTNTADSMYSPYQDTLSNEVRCFGASSC